MAAAFFCSHGEQDVLLRDAQPGGGSGEPWTTTIILVSGWMAASNVIHIGATFPAPGSNPSEGKSFFLQK